MLFCLYGKMPLFPELMVKKRDFNGMISVYS
ncbi:hypothetical protein BSUW23_06090 [Bacillus spizizenii str. W23]|uniref:Uncharacterized protein n=1 Tax=Bacillus spizizenii (strain ATCC 23059 / NRRL B-14472 / W23) TaxID=655816 RepID=E0U0C5_BACSH|nr:hypothetical protein BSUW23_06090 [Bacillus spizizenii str. W23]EFG91429.1 hypothetical protein BSU6633_16037 [Bacillus spizizenii ATCC 6633 = JCM 2499]